MDFTKIICCIETNDTNIGEIQHWLFQDGFHWYNGQDNILLGILKYILIFEYENHPEYKGYLMHTNYLINVYEETGIKVPVYTFEEFMLKNKMSII